MTTEQWPLVTVIMPIRNEASFIARSLGAVLAQDYSTDLLEVLAVDGMSDDGTREIVQRMLAGRPRACLLDNAQRIVPTAMNIGLAAAGGDVIIRVDGHTVIAPDYVKHCVDALVETGADCVGGPMRAVADTPFGQAVALATSHPFGVGGSRFHYATESMEVDSVYMGAWPRQVFGQVGSFDEEMVRNQDDELSYRLRAAGGRIWLDPGIHSTYYARSTLGSLWRQYFQYGFWKVRVFQKVPGSAQLRHWVPALFVLGIAGGFIAALLLPLLRPLYLGALGFYVGLNLFVSLSIALRAGWDHALRLPVAFATLHLAYGVGFWRGIVRFGLPWRNRDRTKSQGVSPDAR